MMRLSRLFVVDFTSNLDVFVVVVVDAAAVILLLSQLLWGGKAV
jgi:hypothetical protein